jgi:ribosome maturation factor RimP
MKLSARYLSAVVALALPFTVSSAFAQDQRLQGTIVSVNGPALVLKTDKGEVKVNLTDKAQVLAVEKVKMDGIKQGEFIGVGAMPQADGTQKAVRINIFDESRRGSNEGHRPGWGPDAKGTMTNATVDTTVGSVDGQMLTVKYKDGEKKIVVPPDAIIQRNVAGSAADLKPGATVQISAATPKGEGMFETARVAVGRDGYVPQ